MQEIDGVKYFTQEELNGFAATARKEGRDSNASDVLKTLGVASLEEVTTLVAEAKTLKASSQTDLEKAQSAITEGQTKLTAAEQRAVTAELKANGVLLEREAETVAESLGVAKSKAKQILKLIDIDASKFEEGKTDIKGAFETFLAVEDNKHFVTGGAAALPVTPGRKPAGGAAKDDKFAQLMGSMSSIKR